MKIKHFIFFHVFSLLFSTSQSPHISTTIGSQQREQIEIELFSANLPVFYFLFPCSHISYRRVLLYTQFFGWACHEQHWTLRTATNNNGNRREKFASCSFSLQITLKRIGRFYLPFLTFTLSLHGLLVSWWLRARFFECIVSEKKIATSSIYWRKSRSNIDAVPHDWGDYPCFGYLKAQSTANFCWLHVDDECRQIRNRLSKLFLSEQVNESFWVLTWRLLWIKSVS